VTTNYVVAESATRLRYDAGLRAALRFRDAIKEALALRSLRLVWIDQRLDGEGWDVLAKYADIDLSLTDGTSAAVARRHGIREIFGFDEDFAALGFTLTT
jgi:predicted nucleic acid-binding protein